MKKVVVLCYVVLVMLVPAFLFIIGCAAEDECPLNPEPAYYYIRFTMDGPEYTLDEQVYTVNYSHPYYNSKPSAILSPDESNIFIVGQICGNGSERADIALQLHGYLSPSTPGVYIGTYDDTGSDAGFFISLFYEITEPYPNNYFYLKTGGTITINTFGDVGGDVEGNFDITIESTVPVPAPSFGLYLTVVGEFRLLRLSDEYFPAPFPNPYIFKKMD
jgi:hypothetical protein